MSTPKDSSDQQASATAAVPWKAGVGLAFTLAVFIGSQLAAGIMAALYPLLRGWSEAETAAWFEVSLAARLGSMLLYGVILLLAVRAFLRYYKTGFKIIGLVRPKVRDFIYGLAALPAYFLVLAVTVAIAQALVPGLDVDQRQELGFDDVYHGLELVLIGLVLVGLVPFIEEVVFRGLIYGSLRKKAKPLLAALVTSVLFAVGHLAASSEGPLYIAAIDTFVLSLILVYLREKTGSLWPAIGLHAIKNAIAFITVFVLRAA